MATDDLRVLSGWIAAEPPRRKRRKWPIVLLVILVLIGGGLFALNAAARPFVEDRIEESLRDSLSLDASTDVDVVVGGGPVLFQLVRGNLDRIVVTSPSVAFGDLTGAAVLTATDVPLDQSQPLGTLTMLYSVDADELREISANLSGLPITAVAIGETDVTVSAEFEVLGVTVPLGIGIEPSAVNGALAFEPTSIRLGDATITASTLRDRFGALADLALQTQDFCIAEYLPQAFTLDSVGPLGDRLVLHLNADGVALGGSAMTTTGTCS